MGRRPGRGGRRVQARTGIDPFIALSADYAWCASDATDNGSVTTALVPYIGGLTLTRLAAGQGVPTASSGLRGAEVVVFDSLADDGYTGALAVSAGFSVISVIRALGTGAVTALNVGAAANTGNYSGVSGATAFAQKVTSISTSAIAVPGDAIIVGVFDANGRTVYANALTGVTAAQAGALVGDTFLIGCAAAATFAMNGHWERTAVFRRALTATEVGFAMRSLGTRFGITIAP